MILSLILGVLIFGYAGWTMYRHVKRSRKGKCAACSLNETCQVACTPSITRAPAAKGEM